MKQINSLQVSKNFVNLTNFKLFLNIEKIANEFGAIGLLIYSQIKNLNYFDIEKEMIVIN
jgi:hypothetical protein